MAPGEPALLAKGEGILIVQVDTDLPLESIELDRALVSGPLPRGRHVWLVRLPRGAYHWDRIRFRASSGAAVLDTFAFERDAEGVRFEIRPGRIHYAGELVVRRASDGRSPLSGIEVRNRSHPGMAFRALLETHPQILASHPLEQAGAGDDAFLDHLERALGTSRRAPKQPRSSDPGERVLSSPMPLAPEQGPSDLVTPARGAARTGHPAAVLFSRDGVESVELSPTGEWIVAHAIHGSVHGLLVQGKGIDGTRTVFSAESRLLAGAWIGRDDFMAVYDSGNGPRTLWVEIVERPDGVVLRHEWIEAPGGLIDPLPLVEGEVLWHLGRRFETDAWESRLHRVSIADLVGFRDMHRLVDGSLDHRAFGETLATLRGRVDRWIVDRRGRPRAALRRTEEGSELLTRGVRSTSFTVVTRLEERGDPGSIDPIALTPDSERLVVRARGSHDTIGLFELDMANGTLLERIFGLDGIDVSGALFDPLTGELIAARFVQEGEARFRYLDALSRSALGLLRQRFPDDEIEIRGASVDRSVFVVRISGATDPGSYHLLDRRTGRATRIARAAARAGGLPLAEVEAITVPSRDGTPVEAFLTLPNELPPGGAPLILRPHGGPIGVQDTRDFDPLGQYLASWGFATLQVNYRGSGGYGRAFLQAGQREWARGIEDDLDAAVEQVMRRPGIDASRICVLGASYGGFSAVASVLRHLDRYRCAVAWNGVFDVPHMFEEGECSDIEACLDVYARIIGDPEADRDELLRISPAYHVDEIETPILVVYGTDDVRVDPDHSHRLILMMELLGKPHEVLELQRGTHSPTRRERVIFARVARRFLTRHLLPGTTFVEDPMAIDGGRSPTPGRPVLRP
ncbi:MAG: S9 family peptidase [bacterium]